ncbi:B-cell receptor CD22-like [Pleuronectes platessa]|uniref:B-cell receptor CD22-like n=1 Tax=Pleuronectes platessa TaxID=8262 RepID=UPI00232A77D6|nr:B-cell receptor CD22-like [Pleuronectes platessa]
MKQQKMKKGASYTGYFHRSARVSCAVKGLEDFRSTSMLVRSLIDWSVSYTSTEICAFRGSTVDINCIYTYPSWWNGLHTTVNKTFWFIKVSNGIHVDLRTDPEYSGRVENLCGNNKCTLRISNLRESDSAVYKFMFTTNQPTGNLTGSAGVTLNVTDPQLQVHVRRSTANPSSTWTELTCHSRCQLPDHLSYVWYNKNKPVGRKKYFHLQHFNPEDSYHCAIEGQERFPSPTLYYPSDAPKPPSVSVSPSGEIMEGSSVTLTCSSDANPAAKYTWYKRSGHKQDQRLSEETQFVLSSIRSSDSGEFYCTAENELGRSSANIFITVTYAPKPPSVSVSPSGEIMEGSSVTLTCSSDANPAANYTWYKEDRALLHGPEGIYRLSSISSGDSGVYSCKSENQYGRITSTSLHLDVQWHSVILSFCFLNDTSPFRCKLIENRFLQASSNLLRVALGLTDDSLVRQRLVALQSLEYTAQHLNMLFKRPREADDIIKIRDATLIPKRVKHFLHASLEGCWCN